MKSIQHFVHHVMVCLLVAVGAVSVAGAAEGTPAKPSWHCLSENTVAAVHLPDPAGFAVAMEQRTRIGQLLFAEQRRAALREGIAELMGDEWEEMLEFLGRYEMEPEDLLTLAGGGGGAALTLEPRPGREPVVVLLTWAEPGADLAQRIVSAADKAAADALEEGAALERYDIELAGQAVMHLSFPVEGLDQDLSWDVPDNWMEMSQEEQQEHWERQTQRREEAETIVTDRTHLMLTRMGGRLLMATTFPQSEQRVQRMEADARAQLDWDELTGLEEASGVFARFLTRHDGEDGRFVQDMRRTPGLLAALPAGESLAEVYANPPAVLRVLQESGTDDDAESMEEMVQTLGELGLDGIGPLALKMSLDANVFRSDGFGSVPAPRRGILELLEQPALPAEPAEWVSTEATGYAHMSLDLAELYRRIREQMIAEGDDDVRAGFEWTEQWVEAQTRLPLIDILGSLGHRHMFASFESRVVEVEQPDYSQFDPETGDVPTETVEQPQPRMAFVWELREPQVWEQLFQLIGMWASMAPPEMVQAVEEQGFSGWRMEEGAMAMGLFRGRGHLLITLGEEVAEMMFAMLRTPPTGEAALHRSALRADADRVLPPRPGVYYSITDYNRTLLETRNMFLTGFEQGFTAAGGAAGPADSSRSLLEQLLPEEAELDGAVGVLVSQGYLTEDGLVLESALDLPPAE